MSVKLEDHFKKKCSRKQAKQKKEKMCQDHTDEDYSASSQCIPVPGVEWRRSKEILLSFR